MTLPLYRGVDKKIDLTIRDNAPPHNPIPISTFAGIVVYVDVDGRIIAKYSLNAKPGFDPITIVDDPNGVIQILLQKKDTKSSPLGIVSFETKVSVTDVDFDDGDADDVYRAAATRMLDAESRLTEP